MQCGVSENDIETSTKRSPRPTRTVGHAEEEEKEATWPKVNYAVWCRL